MRDAAAHMGSRIWKDPSAVFPVPPSTTVVIMSWSEQVSRLRGDQVCKCGPLEAEYRSGRSTGRAHLAADMPEYGRSVARVVRAGS
jgi:hypothetical protein